VSSGRVTQLGYLVVGASDVERWVSFGREVLGMAEGRRLDSGAVELRMDERAYRLVVEPRGLDDVATIGWQVAGPDDLDLLHKRLSDAGVQIERDDAGLAAERRVGGALGFRDPSGLPLEVFWGAELSAAPFVPGRPISGFLTGSLGLGHVVLAADDVAASVDLYRNVLGFQLTDHGSGPFTFLRCNPRHHSVALGPAAAVKSPKRLLHFMVEFSELDDVGTAYDLCHDRDIPIAITLGRHGNDRMVSFYAFTPSGFRFECGYGGLLVGDDWQVPTYQARDVWGHRRIDEPLKPGHEAPTTEDRSQ
jgi:extradiol dioxygenase